MKTYDYTELRNRYHNLISAISEKGGEYREDDLENVDRCMNSFYRYVGARYNMNRSVPVIRVKYEGSEVRTRIQDIDHSRTLDHESAISNAGMLDRLCENYGVRPVFGGDTGNRLEVADFCLAMVTAFFGVSGNGYESPLPGNR